MTRIAECGGLDAYLLKTPEEEIDSQFGIELKRLILLVSVVVEEVLYMCVPANIPRDISLLDSSEQY